MSIPKTSDFFTPSPPAHAASAPSEPFLPQSLSHFIPNPSNMVNQSPVSVGPCKRKRMPSPNPENLSSTSLSNNPANPSSALLSHSRSRNFVPEWLCRMLLRWEEELRKTPESPYLWNILLNNGPITQDLINIAQCPVNKDKIKNILFGHRQSALTRDQEPWSQIEQAFLLALASYAQDEATLLKVAIALNRSMENCRIKWQELIQQASLNTTPNLTQTASDQKRAQSIYFQWTEWEKAMIALWISKSQTPDRAKNLEEACRDIAIHLFQNTYLGIRLSVRELTQKLCRLIKNAREKNISFSADRSKEPWSLLEQYFLREMLFYRQDLSLKENAKENLHAVLCLLRRAPVDATLNKEDLKNLKVPSSEDLRQLDVSFHRESDPVHPMRQKQHHLTQARITDSWPDLSCCKDNITSTSLTSDGSKRVRDVAMHQFSSMTSTFILGGGGPSALFTDTVSFDSEARSEELSFEPIHEEMRERSSLSQPHADKEPLPLSPQHPLLFSSEQANATGNPRSLSFTSTVGPLVPPPIDTASSVSQARSEKLPFDDDLLAEMELLSPLIHTEQANATSHPLSISSPSTAHQPDLSSPPLSIDWPEETPLPPTTVDMSLLNEENMLWEEMDMDLGLDLLLFPPFPDLKVDPRSEDVGF